MTKRIFDFLHAEQITKLTIDVLSFDSAIVKVHPNGCGAEKKTGTIHRKITRRLDYKSYICWWPMSEVPWRFTLLVAVVMMPLQGRKLLESQGVVNTNISLLMDRAYEGDNTHGLALKRGYGLCVPPKSNRKEP